MLVEPGNTAFLHGFRDVTRTVEIGRGRRRTLDFSLGVGCLSLGPDPPLRVQFPFDQMLAMVDAIAYVRILEVGGPQQLMTDDRCYAVRPHVARPIRLINVRRQPGDGSTFRFFVPAWDTPLAVGDELITFLSHEESRIYYEWGDDYRMPFINGRLAWSRTDVPQLLNGATAAEVLNTLRKEVRRQPPPAR